MKSEENVSKTNRPRPVRQDEPGVSVHIEGHIPQDYVEKLMRDMLVDDMPIEFYIRRN